MPKATVLTLGCKVNQYESRGMIDTLVKAGYTMVPRGQAVDLTVINACTVTQKAAFETRAMARRAHRANPDGISVVAGCYAQVRPEDLVGLPGVALVLGQEYKQDFLSILADTDISSGPLVKVSALKSDLEVSALGFPGFDRTRAFFRIQDGCSAWCSYCIVPKTRGPSRSMSLDKVLTGLRAYEKAGYTEVVFTGIHLGAWGLDLCPSNNLAGLLEQVEKESFQLRLRLSSIEPAEVTPELIKVIRRFPDFCPHLHLALQSGDDEVLAKMRRSYTGDFFRDLILSLAADWPELCLGADVLVGFPGEEEQAFVNTRDLIQELPMAYLHVFPYSKRPGTVAANMPGQVADWEIKRRAAALREIGLAKRLAFNERHQGQIRPTLIENTRDRKTGLTRGLTDNYIQVLIPDSILPAGKIVPVKLTDQGPENRMIGSAV
ncbi:MAG: tRNA (N(6)-L-threonylcarbamoyladenosine(37)-C(2))-methylthiotransferase MtaB [Deltaproteobacteria bacterium]|nr:tRNA (N(6)-L-threonylcarbamoyladenosine(37)-C(2))-methylthiotransferase MtaB [Deltaproteobacteria bacterium]MBW2051615.1 tRNA (N(6)-L-threonylcarbamoyladenosine(37)-C(2))-methylthiotransferase MtaB [Deltaproteobacteria bacterium]MBW2140749.1 tRNA (N(6)-L-threonylcarbamoyladenosine(37)-C(2))-methylthiotransferase MtaB [Deltaproteobacteria bacterium]MBW2322700.1 tRNA (N(6)-L-threonylcarbamoyladenosine(37)-C(2))-methylthiotransferase MtaB [Deltaproteobacteria bacterium]